MTGPRCRPRRWRPWSTGSRDRLLSGPLLVNWHAGEPLALRTSFYRERIPLFEPLTAEGVDVTHSLQTNATLITDSYCELFAEYGVHVGVSLDGPRSSTTLSV